MISMVSYNHNNAVRPKVVRTTNTVSWSQDKKLQTKVHNLHVGLDSICGLYFFNLCLPLSNFEELVEKYLFFKSEIKYAWY